MHYLTGLEWSTGCFGLAIGILIGAAFTWLAKPTTRIVVSQKLDIDAAPSEAVDKAGPNLDQRWPALVEPPVTRCDNPLVLRMYERWAACARQGDRVNRMRQEMRMLSAGIEPPVDLNEAENLIAILTATR